MGRTLPRRPYRMPRKQAIGKTQNIATLNQSKYGKWVRLNTSAHPRSRVTIMLAIWLPIFEATHVAAAALAPQRSTHTANTHGG